MHVAQINFLPAPRGLGLAALLERWPSLADIAELVAGAGVRVTVLQAAAHAERLTRAGVDYHLVDMRGTWAAQGRGRRFAAVLGSSGVDVLHAHSLAYVEDAFAVASNLAPGLPVVLQDHADRPPRWWRRPRHRRHFAAAAGVAFTSVELARPFVAAGVLDPATRLFAIPESSSRFTPGDRAHARAAAGVYGEPCALWVGRLNRGKDPLTVLDGIALAAERMPGLQLWCAFGEQPMLAEVQARIDADRRLAGRVHLLGRVAHVQVETLMRAADLFVSGSRAEGSGYAAMEALACGLMPVLTDIPAFRALSGNGRIGSLWPCGDAAALAAALVDAAVKRPSPQQVRAHFDETLSFKAVGRLWTEAYARVLDDCRAGLP
ncbi:glycosyltransferase family 4 protein [Rhodanobacter geophilus]|uniref:Glycosyltransferase family 4 protein n=1 Tax=Rhodanobacter geophilus TaxID=3162488 RepID=A0ABV3QLR7_9GAMM